MDRGVIVGGGLIAASFLVAVLLNRSANDEAPPAEAPRELPVPACEHVAKGAAGRLRAARQSPRRLRTAAALTVEALTGSYQNGRTSRPCRPPSRKYSYFAAHCWRRRAGARGKSWCCRARRWARRTPSKSPLRLRRSTARGCAQRSTRASRRSTDRCRAIAPTPKSRASTQALPRSGTTCRPNWRRSCRRRSISARSPAAHST